MPSTKIYDVAVIGGGVMGSATAYYLSKSCKNVILLEQFDFLHRKGSSHGDSRIIRQTYPQEHYTELMLSAYKLWAEIEKDSGTKVFTKTGGLDFGKETNPLLVSLLKTADKYQIRHDVIRSSEELSRRFPTLTLPEGSIAVYTPSSGILNATKAVSVFQNQAKKQGCVMKDNCKVIKVSRDIFCVEIHTQCSNGLTSAVRNGEIIRARKCIFTTGPWTKKVLMENLCIDLPLTPEQTTIAYWKVDHPEEYSSKKFPVFINYDEPLMYGTPAHEYPNMIKCAVHYGKTVDPDHRDFEPAMEGLIQEAAPFLQKYFKGVHATPVMTESCVYTWSPDQDFIIDELPGSGGSLWVGCGFSGHGFKLAPIVGKMLSEMTLKGKHPYPRAKKHFSMERLGIKWGMTTYRTDKSKL